MKIVAVEARLVDLPLPRPIATAIHAIRSVGCVLVTVRTDDGVAGRFASAQALARLEAERLAAALLSRRSSTSSRASPPYWQLGSSSSRR